jgi:hypothetical protein
VIGEPTFADAILDRIVHNAYRLALDGPSMRKVKAGEEDVAMLADMTENPEPTKPTKGSRK